MIDSLIEYSIYFINTLTTLMINNSLFVIQFFIKVKDYFEVYNYHVEIYF